jgi:hypothetical protein
MVRRTCAHREFIASGLPWEASDPLLWPSLAVKGSKKGSWRPVARGGAGLHEGCPRSILSRLIPAGIVTARSLGCQMLGESPRVRVLVPRACVREHLRGSPAVGDFSISQLHNNQELNLGRRGLACALTRGLRCHLGPEIRSGGSKLRREHSCRAPVAMVWSLVSWAIPLPVPMQKSLNPLTGTCQPKCVHRDSVATVSSLMPCV